MNIHFIDTSVFANILDIPNMNADCKLVIAEFNKRIKNKKERIILPYATLIETGNHIAHIPNGNKTRNIAMKFNKMLINILCLIMFKS